MTTSDPFSSLQLVNKLRCIALQVEWRPDPFGEGGTGWIPFKNLRPSLRWAAKRWQMLVHLTGPLGKIVVPVGGSEAVKQTPGEVDGAEAETAGIAEKRGSSAGGPKKEAEEAPCKRDISVRGPEPGAKETPCKRPDSAGGSTPEAKQAPRKRPGPAGGSTPEGKETPRKRPGEPGTEAAPERPAKAGKKAANASPTEAKPPPKPGKSKEGAGTLKNKSTPPRIRPPPKVRTPLEIKPLPEKQSPSKVRTPHEGQESLKERPPPETLLLPKVRIPEKVFTPEEARTPSKVQDSPKPRHLHKVGERPTEDAGLQGRGESEERPRGVPGKKCFDCGTEKTTAWRRGPMGENTLCQTCGVRYWLKKLREKKLGRSDACGWEEADAVRRPGAEGAPSGGAAGLTAGTRSEKSCLHCGSGQHDAIHSRTGPPGGETRCKTCEVRKYASRLGVDCVPGGGHQIIETVRAAGRQRDGGGRYLARRGEPTKRLSKGFSKPSAEPTRRTPQKDFRRTGVTNDERGVRRGPGLGSGNFFDRKVDRSALEGKSTETLMHPKAGDRHGLERGLGRVLGGLENLRQGAPSEKKRTARELGLPELSESSKRIRIQSNSVKSASARIVGQALRNIRIRPDASGAFGKAASDAFGNAASERKGAKEEKERKVGGSEAAQAEGIRTQSDDPAVSECRSSEGEQSERDDENESEEAEREEVKVERERKKRAEARRKKRERIGRLKAQLACSIGEPKGQKVARLKAQLACSVGEPDRTGKRVTRQVARTDEGEGGVKSGVAKEGATSGKRVEATKGGLTRERRASDVGVVDKALSSAAKKLAVYQKLKRAVGGPDKVTRPKRRPKKGARREPPRRNPQGGRKSDEEESGGKSDASGAEVDSDEGEKGAGLPGVGTFKKQCVLKRAKQKGPGRPVFWGVNLDELIMEEEFELPENVRARAERELAQVRRRVSEVSGEAGSSGRDSAEGDEVLIHSVKVVGNKGRKESAGLSEKAGTESSTVGLETRIKSGMTESWMGLAFEKSLQMGQGGSSIQGGSQTSKTVPLESFVENEKDGVESRSVGQVKSGSTEIVSGIGAGESLPLVEASDLGGSQACETMPVETEDGMAHGEGGAGSSGKTPPEVVQPLPPDEAAFAEESDSVLDKAEALSAAEELLSRWEEASLDEARGLFLMVNLWSPDEESLGDPVAWYRDKIEALAFRGERFVEVGGAANVGAFRKWAVGPNDGEGTAEGDGHDRAPEGMKEVRARVDCFSFLFFRILVFFTASISFCFQTESSEEAMGRAVKPHQAPKIKGRGCHLTIPPYSPPSASASLPNSALTVLKV